MNCIAPVSCSIRSIVRLIKAIHSHSIFPLVYHVSNLFPLPPNQIEKNVENLTQWIQMLCDSQNHLLYTLDSSSNNETIFDEKKGHWNYIVEELPYDEQDWIEYEHEIQFGLSQEKRDHICIQLLMRMANIADSLQIDTFLWPLEKKYILDQWKKVDYQVYKKYKFILIESAINPELELVALYAKDKQTILSHLESHPLESLNKNLTTLKGTYFVPHSNILELFELDSYYDPEWKENPFDQIVSQLTDEERLEMVTKDDFCLDNEQESYPKLDISC